jgi:hemerythrin superfamily protein
MTISMQTGSDVVSFLKGQHTQVKAMFDEVATSRGEARATAFRALRRALAVHEVAEEEVVHPAAERALPDGKEVVAARLREENSAKKALAELEQIALDSPEFEAKLVTLKMNVVRHAESEEREEFDRLASRLEPARLERMRKLAEFAEAVAPTRPHAGVESAAANLLAGPFASMLDRARDIVAK